MAGSTDLPIMVYNNPVEYKIEVTLQMFEQLLECENIQAVKESTRDITNVTRMINAFGDRYKLLCGVDTIAMEELMLGAVGWVAGLGPKLVQYIKLTEERAGVGSEHVRAPRLKLEGKERAEALKIIDLALATRPVLPDYLAL